MAEMYQVVAECAFVTVSTVTGRAGQLLLKGAPVPADAPELKRLVAEGYVAKAGSAADVGGVDAAGIPAAAYTAEVPEAITSTPVEKAERQRKASADADEKTRADGDLADKRAAARAKLPADGSAPDGRASQAVWVEYLVGQGGSYDDLAKADKADLVKLAEQRKQ